MTEILEIQELCTQQARSHLDALGFLRTQTQATFTVTPYHLLGKNPAQTGYKKKKKKMFLFLRIFLSLFFFFNCDLLKNTVKWTEHWFKEVSNPIIWQTFQAEELK